MVAKRCALFSHLVQFENSQASFSVKHLLHGVVHSPVVHQKQLGGEIMKYANRNLLTEAGERADGWYDNGFHNGRHKSSMGWIWTPQTCQIEPVRREIVLFYHAIAPLFPQNRENEFITPNRYSWSNIRQLLHPPERLLCHLQDLLPNLYLPSEWILSVKCASKLFLLSSSCSCEELAATQALGYCGLFCCCANSWCYVSNVPVWVSAF